MSSKNAITHGLAAQDLVVRGGDVQEDPAEFEALREAVYKQWEPEGGKEEFFADRIAVYLWKERRAWRCEKGEILRRGANVKADFARHLDERLIVAVRYYDRTELERWSRGVEYLIYKLNPILEQLKAGRLDGEPRDSLYLFKDELAVVGIEVPSLNEATPPPESLDKLRARLEVRQRELIERLPSLQQMEASRVDAEIASRALPTPAQIERLRRYTGPNGRELNRAIIMLDDLQARRAGERGRRRRRDAAE